MWFLNRNGNQKNQSTVIIKTKDQTKIYVYFEWKFEVLSSVKCKAIL